MVKECPVVTNNDKVTVAKFGDVMVQFSSIQRDEKSVFVEYDGKRYRIVDKPCEKKSRKSRKNTELQDEHTGNVEVCEVTSDG